VVPEVTLTVQAVILVSAPEEEYVSTPEPYLNASVVVTNEAANAHDLHSFFASAKKYPVAQVKLVVLAAAAVAAFY